MIRCRFFPAFLLSCVPVFGVLAGPPTLTFPENKASDQPSDLTLTWEAGALTNYAVNGDFEKSSGGWGASGTSGQILSTESQPAYSGNFFVQIEVNPHSLNTILFQPISLPPTGGSARLS